MSNKKLKFFRRKFLSKVAVISTCFLECCDFHNVLPGRKLLECLVGGKLIERGEVYILDHLITQLQVICDCYNVAVDRRARVV